MRILIEEHQYQAEQIRDVLHGIDAMQDIDGNVSINYVGITTIPSSTIASSFAESTARRYT